MPCYLYVITSEPETSEHKVTGMKYPEVTGRLRPSRLLRRRRIQRLPHIGRFRPTGPIDMDNIVRFLPSRRQRRGDVQEFRVGMGLASMSQ